MPKLTDRKLLARDVKRDIGVELLQAARDLRNGRYGRKTSIEVLPDGFVRCLVELPSGEVARDEVVTGARWVLLSVRHTKAH